MWMCRDRGIEFYKHIDTRRYLLLDSESRCWRQGDSGLELSDFEREFRRVTELGMPKGEREHADASPSSQTGRWIGDISAERVDNLWRPEDHEAVIHNLRAADRLATQVVEFASRQPSNNFRRYLKEG